MNTSFQQDKTMHIFPVILQEKQRKSVNLSDIRIRLAQMKFACEYTTLGERDETLSDKFTVSLFSCSSSVCPFLFVCFIA